MSILASTRDVAIERLAREDPTLQWILFDNHGFSDEDVKGLMWTLVYHPNVVTSVDLTGNELTDETGALLAEFVSRSSTIKELYLSKNKFTVITLKLLAQALHVNKSLSTLQLVSKGKFDMEEVDVAFSLALCENPERPDGSLWQLGNHQNSYSRLKQ